MKLVADHLFDPKMGLLKNFHVDDALVTTVIGQLSVLHSFVILA